MVLDGSVRMVGVRVLDGSVRMLDGSVRVLDGSVRVVGVATISPQLSF